MISLNYYVSGNRRGAGRDAKRARWYAQRDRIRDGPRISRNIPILHIILVYCTY